MRTVTILDTTLRDGEAAPGNAMTREQKIEVALAIDDLEVDVIEPGFPASSQLDFEVARELSLLVRNARLNAFCRASRDDVDIAVEAFAKADRPMFQIMTVGSEIHLEHKRRISAETAIAEGVDAIAYAKSLGIEDVAVAPEDATRGSLSYLRWMLEAGIEAGANSVVLPDTTGGCTPRRFAALVEDVRRWVGPDIRIAIHTHDDLGLAVANATAGVGAGADEVQVTLCGIGERAGNASLEELAAVLHYHSVEYGALTSVRKDLLFEAAQRLMELIDLPTARHKSIIGKNVFSTEAGIHQAGILHDPRTYEFVEPGVFGRERTLRIGRHSGRAMLRHLLSEMRVTIDLDALELLYVQIVESEHPEEFNEPELLMASYEAHVMLLEAEAGSRTHR